MDLEQQSTKSQVFVCNNLNVQMELGMAYQDQGNGTRSILLKLELLNNGKVQVKSRFKARKQASNSGIRKVQGHSQIRGHPQVRDHSLKSFITV